MKKYLKLHFNYPLLSLVLALFVMVSSGFKTEHEVSCFSKNTPYDKEIEKSIRVAGFKMMVSNDIIANVAAIKNAIDYAQKEKADILLTPEGSLSGYTPDFNQAEVKKALTEIVEYASIATVGLALGTCFYEDDNKCYNEIRFYDKKGNFLGYHSKILRCCDLEDFTKGEINYYASTPLRIFEFEGVIIGGLICNDLWANPACTTLPDTHLSQQLSKMGAKIIFHAVNGGRSESEWSEIFWNFHESNLKIRANCGNIWIVTADNSDPVHLRSSCPSGVLDTEGKWVCETDAKGIQYFSYTIILK